jgi:transposase
VRKLEKKYDRLHVCCEAGPTGYGLHRQITALGNVCEVMAASMAMIRPSVCGPIEAVHRRNRCGVQSV